MLADVKTCAPGDDTRLSLQNLRRPHAGPRWRWPRLRTMAGARTAGFTLAEMMVVISLIAILMTVVGLGLVQAREISRKARADVELRQLVSAWTQWYETYGAELVGDPPTPRGWPTEVDGEVNLAMDYDLLRALIDPNYTAFNPRGLVLLNASLSPGQDYLDPWKTPYEVSFETTEDLGNEYAIKTSVTLPNRKRIW